VENFPPGASKQSYATDLAVSPDGRYLVVSLNLGDAAAIIDLSDDKVVADVKVDPAETEGELCLPEGVAIIKTTAYVACEGNGTIASFDIDDPATVTITTPQPAATDPVYVDPAKTHPFQIIASPDGRHLYVSETNADRVMILNPSDLSAPAGVIYVRRSEGLGTEPLGLALSPDDDTLFVADAQENAVRAVALTPRTIALPDHRSEQVAADQTISWIPAGIYPDRVNVDPRTGKLMIVSAEGVGPGPNNNSDTAEGGFGDDQQDSIRVLSTLQTFQLPMNPAQQDSSVVAMGQNGFNAAIPIGSGTPPPAGTPVEGPNGGASTKIKYIFYVVAENKTYDAYFGDLSRNPADPTEPGSEPVGNGDPCLTLWGWYRTMPVQRDGSPCPQSRFLPKGIAIRDPGMRMDGELLTPNYHKLALTFGDLDNFYADTNSSDDGHIFTASGYPDDYELRGTEANNGPSPRPFDIVYPQVAPPQGFIFDLLAENHISFFNYGEAISGTLIPDVGLDAEEQVIRHEVLANSDFINYPSSAAIDLNPISVGVNPDVDDPASLAAVGAERVDDSDEPDELEDDVYTKADGAAVPVRTSRELYFQTKFDAELKTPGCLADPGNPDLCTVPQFNYLVMPNNHTAGTTPGRRTPDALVRDNDLAVGQIVDAVSHSAIWPYSAIFVIQDDPQDGADHVDAHRSIAVVVSKYAPRQPLPVIDHNFYTTVSFLRTIEDLLGIPPMNINDAFAPLIQPLFTGAGDQPAFNADYSNRDNKLIYTANTPKSPGAKESGKMDFTHEDRADARKLNVILWKDAKGNTPVPWMVLHPHTSRKDDDGD
jgi:hypothetical protein